MKQTRTDFGLSLDGDNYRVEEGPALVTATCTKELLSDAKTAPHYFEGVNEVTEYDAEGKPYTTQKRGVDALGNPIKVGKEITYLDHGGTVEPGSRVFYAYAKVKVDHTKQFLEDGEVNPYFVSPDQLKAGEALGNRPAYSYVFQEIGTAATEDAAIELCEKHASKTKKEA